MNELHFTYVTNDTITLTTPGDFSDHLTRIFVTLCLLLILLLTIAIYWCHKGGMFIFPMDEWFNCSGSKQMFI